MRRILTFAALVLLTHTVAAQGSTYFVKKGGTGLQDGSDWNNAWAEVSTALTNTIPGDTILVAEGTYYPSVQSHGSYPRSVTFAVNGIRLSGGFTGDPNFSTVFEPDGNTNATILSGDIGTPGLETDNAFHVVTVTGGNSTIDGFKIIDGYADQIGSASPPVPSFENGGGIRVDSAGLVVLRRLTVSDSLATLGAGIYVHNATLHLSKSRIRGNTTANGRGAGLYMDHSNNSRVYNTHFKSNSSPTSTTGKAEGGAIYCTYDVPGLIVANCVFHDNTAMRGGAICVHEPEIGFASRWINNTIAFNRASVDGGGGGMFVRNNVPTADGAVLVYNSVFHGNEGGTVASDILDQSGTPSLFAVEHTCSDPSVTPAPPWAAGSGNLAADPLFVNAAARNLSLNAGSPCNDAGNDNHLPLDWLDIDGNGATSTQVLPLDFRGSDSVNHQREMEDWASTSTTGVDGGPPDTDIVDIGAYEKRNIQGEGEEENP